MKTYKRADGTTITTHAESERTKAERREFFEMYARLMATKDDAAKIAVATTAEYAELFAEYEPEFGEHAEFDAHLGWIS